jgi:predicted amidohydrolase YtcJ
VSSKPKVFTNAVIHTVDPERPNADWFVTIGRRFQRVGSGPPPEGMEQVDLAGRTVVPGFVDAHAHFFQTGLDLLFVDLAGATSVDEIGKRLAAGARGRRSWIFAHSYEEEVLEDVDRVTRHEIDRLFPQRPVWINRVDYHSSVVNTPALSRLDVPSGMPGLLVDSAGHPNGILRSEAYFYAKARVSRLYPIETKERAVRTVADRCLRHGITSVHALEGGKVFGDEGVQTLLRKIEKLPLDVIVFLQEMNVPFTTRFGFEHLGGCILMDGSIGSYTAALDTDYADMPGQRGVLYEKPREFAAFVEEAHVEGVQLAFHAIGPRAIEQVLDAYERALNRHPRYDHRHRIEHFELATDRQIARARDLGVICSMQPSFEYYWGGPDKMYSMRLGDAWRDTNRLRTILDAGIRIAGGSDTNVTPPEPLLGIHAAVNHPNEEQRVTPEEALRMMTIDAAFAGLKDREHGSISPGKWADFVVLDADPCAVDRTKIREIEVLETWCRGRRAWPPREKTAIG